MPLLRDSDSGLDLYFGSFSSSTCLDFLSGLDWIYILARARFIFPLPPAWISYPGWTGFIFWLRLDFLFPLQPAWISYPGWTRFIFWLGLDSYFLFHLLGFLVRAIFIFWPRLESYFLFHLPEFLSQLAHFILCRDEYFSQSYFGANSWIFFWGQ